MSATETVHVLVEIHHLEAVELGGDLLDLILLARLGELDAFSIPVAKSVRIKEDISSLKYPYHLM